MPEDILLQVYKPARYIGREWNVPSKDFTGSEVRFALGFADLYEVGMSNLGMRILYDIINRQPRYACERFFSPQVDLEGVLRQQGRELFSLESCSPLKVFDFVGFSLGSELSYTNVLAALSLAGIPLQAALRGKEFPLIVGGGPCTLNPEPMHEFFDLFIIGEGEEVLVSLLEEYRKSRQEFKSGSLSKIELLTRFAQMDGVYVPSLYEVTYDPQGKITGFLPQVSRAPVKIKKRIVEDLDAAAFPVAWLVPYIQIVHDRVTLEIMRGCPNQCRFCQARSQYYPLRQRKPETVLRLAEESYARTGYEEISLTGLSVSEYRGMEELLPQLVQCFKPRAVGISLPSLKAKAMVGSLSSLIATIKKTGLTFAPEAGSERLRVMLAKDFDEQEFFTALEEAYKAGYQHVKLYFMIGLPFEAEEDLDAIVDFSVRVSDLRKKINGRPAEVNISINALIPKPHTSFQWFAMEGAETVARKHQYLRDKMKRFKRLKLNFHNRDMSFLEGVLSRGDRRLSRVILRAFESGAHFDAWSDHFNFEKWMEAFRAADIDPCYYLKEKSCDELLPWDFIDVGISKELLAAEFNKIVAKDDRALYNRSSLHEASMKQEG